MKFHMKGTELYEKIRHLAPIARSSLNANNRCVRIRCIGSHVVEFAAVGRAATVRTYGRFDGESLDHDAVVETEVIYKMAGKLKKHDVALELKHDGGLEMAAGNVTTTFSKVEGPVLPDKTPGQRVLTMPAAMFAEPMAQALPYASTDDSRPALCGVHCDVRDGATHVTATDGHRLFTRSLDPEEWTLGAELPADGVTLPDVALKLALKLVDASTTSSSVEIFVDDEHLVLEQVGVFRVDVDRITSTFPDFRQCIPALHGMPIATFDSRAMREALDTATPFVSKSEAVRVVYSGSVQVVVVDGDAGRFDADLEGEFDGERMVTLSFNRKYLGAACGTFGDGGIRQYVGESVDPQIFVRADDVEKSTRIVVMPMRL